MNIPPLACDTAGKIKCDAHAVFRYLSSCHQAANGPGHVVPRIVDINCHRMSIRHASSKQKNSINNEVGRLCERASGSASKPMTMTGGLELMPQCVRLQSYGVNRMTLRPKDVQNSRWASSVTDVPIIGSAAVSHSRGCDIPRS